ncbi:MAG TPA: phage holin family protein [Gemmataceae bacterium]|nr:phage holin family protein [Gemmataceae bacterium]
MAMVQDHPPAASMTSLVGGIIGDAEELIKQQLTLFRSEIREEFRKAQEAAIMLAIGVGVLLIGVLILELMLPLLLNWLWPVIPLWVCFAIIGGIHTIAGIILLMVAIKDFRAVHAVPERSVEALRENLQWTTHLK